MLPVPWALLSWDQAKINPAKTSTMPQREFLERPGEKNLIEVKVLWGKSSASEVLPAGPFLSATRQKKQRMEPVA